MDRQPIKVYLANIEEDMNWNRAKRPDSEAVSKSRAKSVDSNNVTKTSHGKDTYSEDVS